MSTRVTVRWVAVPLVLLALAVGEFHAARLPDWAQAVADVTEPSPAGVPKYSSRILLSEVRCTLGADGTTRIRKRLAEQILSTAMPEIDYGYFRLERTARNISVKAWHLPPGDRAKRSWMSPIDFAEGDVFLSDMRIRAKAVPDTRKGSLVFFEFEAVDKPHFQMLRNAFFEQTPVTLGRFELQTPPGWKVRWEWLGAPGPEPARAGELYTWEVRDPPLAEPEPLAPSPADQALTLVVNALPPPGTNTLVPVFEQWSDFSSWYDNLIGQRDRVTPGIEQAARQIYSGTGSDFFAKTGAAAMFVRDRVRYVAVELGIGGFQPKTAVATLSSLFGDCKDKTTLFRALLSAAGITSYPVLVNLAADDTVSMKLPVYGFNHLVAAVLVPNGLDIPVHYSPAVLDGDDLGRLLIIDTTDEHASAGTLSAALSGKKGLLVAGPRGRLITLPNPGPQTHRLERQFAFAIHPDRSFGVERISIYHGQFAADARREYGASTVDRRGRAEKRVIRLWPDARVVDYKAQPETPDAAFAEQISATLKPLPTAGLGATFPLFPGAGDEIQRVPLGRRTSPVVYPHPMSIRYDVVLTGMKNAAPLAPPQSISGDGWSVRTTTSFDGETITASFDVTLSRTRFSLDEFPELRKFWSAVTTSAGTAVNLDQ